MPDEGLSTKKLIVLRKLTRAIADLLRGQAKEYLATLAPLLRPAGVLGHHVATGGKETVQGADKAFADMQALYAAVAAARPFNFRKELKVPLELTSSAIDINPFEYVHTATTDQGSKPVVVTSPLKWVLSYSGFAPGRLTHASFAPKRLKEILADRNRSSDELQQFLAQFLAIHFVTSRQPGVAKVLGDLHLPIGTERVAEFGDLPLTCVTSTIATIRPSDEVIVENTEVSGMDVFEEVVDVAAIATMRDPLKDRLIELVKAHGDDLLPDS